MKSIFAALSLFLSFSLPSMAATFTVNSTADVVDAHPGDGVCETGAGNGICTLRAAVQEAGASSGANIISVPAGTYKLTATPSCTYTLVSNPNTLVENMSALCVRGNVTISGAGADSTIIDAGGVTDPTCCGSYPSARGMVIPVGAKVQISGVTIQSGRGSGGYTWVGGGAINNQGSLIISDSILTANIGPPGGGGIWNASTVVVNNVTFTGNTGGVYGGGGLYNNFSATAEVSNSTFQNNISQSLGGAITNYGSLKLLATTLSNNSASSNGGGIYNDYGTLSLTNVTLSGNQGTTGAGISNYQAGTVVANNTTIAFNHATYHGGGVANTNLFTISNSIVGGNYDESNPSVFTDCEGPLVSHGHNLISAVTSACPVTGATSSDIYNRDPKLAPLSSGIGSIPIVALLSTSPAIDAGDPAIPGSGGTACAAADERGILRPQGSRCDMGAYERSATLLVTSISPKHAANAGLVEGVIAGNGMLDGATVSLRRSGQTDIPGTQVTVQAGNSSVTALFDLTAGVAGSWDVVVSNPDGTTATLPGGFAIDSSGSTAVWTETVGPSVVRPGTAPLFYVAFGNRGNVDALDVPITLSMPANTPLALKFLVEPPPVQAGQSATDWSVVPQYVTTGSPSGFINVPLLVPVIPAGYTGTLRFSLQIPTTLQEGDSFIFYATAGDALLQAGVDPSPVISKLAAGAVAYAQAKLGVTVPVSATANVQQYTATQLLSAVDNGRARFTASGGTAIPIYDLAQLNVDAALFAASQATGQPASLLATPVPLDFKLKNGTWKPRSGGGPSNTQVCTVNGQIVIIKKGDVQPSGSSCTDPDIYIPPPPCVVGQKSTAANPCEPPDPDKPFTPADCNDLPGHHVSNSGGLCVPDKGNPCAIIANPVGVTPDCAIIPIKKSVDPNAKFGPGGQGTPQFHTSGTAFHYTVEFENQPTASLPAQQVVVTDQLDTAKLDVSTFSLGPITIGAYTVMPPSGAQQFSGGLDLRPDQNVIVKIDAGVNVATGLLTWRFTTLDPDTEQLTTNAAAGFLPPDVTPPQGEGVLLYSISPKAGIATGTTICNQASVVFDANAAIQTQNWCNTIDDIAPRSSVGPLALTQSAASFPVQWSGSDTGSGIYDYNVYVSDNGGPYVAWLSDTILTQSNYPGVAGHSYAFYSSARDAAFNVEAAKSRPDAETMVTAGTCSPCFLVSATPASGYAVVGASNVYQFAFTDANGSAALQQVSMLIGSSSLPAHACSVAWYRADHTIRLYDDAGSGAYVQGPDSGGSLSNSQCTVSFSHPIVESGNNLTMTLSVTFSAAFAGFRYIYMQAAETGTNTGLRLMGTSTVAAYSPCDVNASQSTDVADVQQVIGEALGSKAASHDLNGDHVVSVLDVQIVINAAMGKGCGAI